MGRKSKEAFGRPSGGHIWTKVHLFLSTHNIWSGKKLSFSPCLLPQLCPKPTTTPQNFLIPKRYPEPAAPEHVTYPSPGLLDLAWVSAGHPAHSLTAGLGRDFTGQRNTWRNSNKPHSHLIHTRYQATSKSVYWCYSSLPQADTKHLKPHMDNTTFGIGVLVLDVSPGLVISGEPINSPIPRKDWIEPPVLIYPWLLSVLLKGQQPRNERWWDKALPEASPPLCD